MPVIVDMIDTVLSNVDNADIIADVRKKVNTLMAGYPIFA
jgi:glycine hydroxymethyltransferase